MKVDEHPWDEGASSLPLDRVRIGRDSCSTKVDVQIPVGDGCLCPIHDWSLIHTTDIPFRSAWVAPVMNYTIYVKTMTYVGVRVCRQHPLDEDMSLAFIYI